MQRPEQSTRTPATCRHGCRRDRRGSWPFDQAMTRRAADLHASATDSSAARGRSSELFVDRHGAVEPYLEISVGLYDVGSSVNKRPSSVDCAAAHPSSPPIPLPSPPSPPPSPSPPLPLPPSLPFSTSLFKHCSLIPPAAQQHGPGLLVALLFLWFIGAVARHNMATASADIATSQSANLFWAEASVPRGAPVAVLWSPHRRWTLSKICGEQALWRAEFLNPSVKRYVYTGPQCIMTGVPPRHGSSMGDRLLHPMLIRSATCSWHRR